MNDFTYSGFKSLIKFKSILSMAIVVFVALWTVPIAAKPPSKVKNDNAVQKNVDNNRESGTASHKNQSGRVSTPDKVSRSKTPTSRAFVAAQSSDSRSPKTSDGIKSVRPDRDSSLSSHKKPVIEVAAENTRSSNRSSGASQRAGRENVRSGPSNQRMQDSGQNIQKSQGSQDSGQSNQGLKDSGQSTRTSGSDKTNQNTRSGGSAGTRSTKSASGGNNPPPPLADTGVKTGATEIRQRSQDSGQNNSRIKISGADKTDQNIRSGNAAGGQSKISSGGKDLPPPPADTGVKTGASEVRQRLRDSGQNNGKIKISGTDKTDQNIRTGNDAGGQSKISSGGKDLPPPPADTGVKTGASEVRQRLRDSGQNSRSADSGPSISDTRKRLGGQDSDNKGLSGDNANKSGKNLPKIDTTPGGINQDNRGNASESISTDRIKQRLSSGDRDGKPGGPQDLNLDKKLDKRTDTSNLKLRGDGDGPGLTTKLNDKVSRQIGDSKAARNDLMKSQFHERLKSGELDKVTKGDIAKKVNLSEQYHLMNQGDVARRMDLNKHVDVKNIHVNNVQKLYNVKNINNINDFYAPRPYYHHGLISPAYASHSFKFVYFGPTFFAGACWYPHWNPWVSWSWHYYPRPIWDPRPIWCRPVIYDPYYDWVYWQPPVWVSLPVVQCGTWVEVEKPVVPEAQYDLQLLAVRFVDPGHPEEKLGPRYRVWLRNNSEQPIEKPFSVMLFAGNEDKLTADMPRSGVRVKSIDAGDTQSVDIRLPIEAASVGRDSDGNPAPFQVLHALVNADREIEESTLANNGVQIPRDEVLSIDPAAFEIDPTNLAAGNELILAGEGLGPQPGQVVLNIAGRELEAEVLGWYDLGVRINLPKMDLNDQTLAEVIVIRGDGAATNPLNVTLMPDQAGPALVLPTSDMP